MINTFFTDSNRDYVAIGDGTIYPVDLFITLYGKDALPCEIKGEQQLSYDDYYDAFLDLLDALGWFAHAYKLLQNAKEDNNPEVNKVRDKYYRDNQTLQKEVKKRQDKCWDKVRELDYQSRKLGFKQMSHDSQKNLLNFLYQKNRRAYFRRRIRGFKDKNQLYSIVDIYNMCVKAQKPR